MSRDGRAQDAAYDVLDGYSTQTEFVPGPMHGHPDLDETVRRIVDALRSIYGEVRR